MLIKNLKPKFPKIKYVSVGTGKEENSLVKLSKELSLEKEVIFLRNIDPSLKIALIATIFSVLGGLFGYFIGYVFFNEVGYKIFEFYGYENVNILKEKFSTQGGLLSWFGILFTAGFTPLPFKIFTITSGFIHFNILFFIFACTVARGLRFFLVAYLTHKFGSRFGPFLEKKGGRRAMIITVIIIANGMASNAVGKTPKLIPID